MNITDKDLMIEDWLGPKSHYSQDIELCDFYTQMNLDCKSNPSRVVWEWLRNAPYLDDIDLDKFKLWNENDQVVCAIRPTSPWLGEAVIDNRCTNIDTLNNIIQYAEDNFSTTEENEKSIFLVLLDQHDVLDNLLIKKGYEKISIEHGTLCFHLTKEIIPNKLEHGYSIRRLSEVYDFDQINQLLWLGFHYEGAIPKINDTVRRSIKHAWLNYNRDVCSVVLDANGDYASFCGFWYDKTTQTAYLEPMITREDNRHQGLGRAAVYHSLRILQDYGCKHVFVDPDEVAYEYYIKLGFEPVSPARFYQKQL